MREPDFNHLATDLLKNGISPRHAHRTVNEVRDHYDDLVDAVSILKKHGIDIRCDLCGAFTTTVVDDDNLSAQERQSLDRHSHVFQFE